MVVGVPVDRIEDVLGRPKSRASGSGDSKSPFRPVQLVELDGFFDRRHGEDDQEGYGYRERDRVAQGESGLPQADENRVPDRHERGAQDEDDPDLGRADSAVGDLENALHIGDDVGIDVH